MQQCCRCIVGRLQTPPAPISQRKRQEFLVKNLDHEICEAKLGGREPVSVGLRGAANGRGRGRAGTNGVAVSVHVARGHDRYRNKCWSRATLGPSPGHKLPTPPLGQVTRIPHHAATTALQIRTYMQKNSGSILKYARREEYFLVLAWY